MIRSLPLLAAATLAGCATMTTADAPTARASLIGSDGGARGTAVLEGTGPAVVLDARGLTPGVHGVHLHGVGRCDAPEFTSAGSHWNPTNAMHGDLNPAGPHAGDLGNVTVAADGTVQARLALPLGDSSVGELLDADGAAVIVHSGRDDLRTDPGGDSGSRVACGVLVRG